MKKKGTLFTVGLGIVVLLFTLFGALDRSFAQSTRQIGLLIDQPPILPMKVESQTLAEIMARLDATRDDLAVTLLHPAEDGFALRDGKPTPLDGFDALLIYQGDNFIETTSLFTGNTPSALKNWLDADRNHGAVLMGGAGALLDRLGGTPVKKTPIKYNSDREQSGIIPVRSAAAIFSGVEIDRQTIWMTNAVYPTYKNLTSASPDMITLARPTTGNETPLLALLTPDKMDASNTTDGPNGEIVKLFVFPWSVSRLYGMADIGFRQNFETLLMNLLSAVGQEMDRCDGVDPPFQLPETAPLERYLDDMEGADDFPDGVAFRAELNALKKQSAEIQNAEEAASWSESFTALRKRAILANPALDFDEILFIRRSDQKLGFPENYNSNSILSPTGYGNRVERLNLRTGARRVVYTPPNDEFVGDLELHFDASRFLFSMPDIARENRWGVWELPLVATEKVAEGTSETNEAPSDILTMTADKLNETDAPPTGPIPTKIPLIDADDVDNYDACYLPDGRLIFCSTACMTGVPCINGYGHVCNLYLKEQDGSIRQLTVEQDHDWCPTVMNNGRVMYLRWEYTDLPHCYSRILFHMNPDGTNQSELYGSGSYWPEALFYARPIPEHPTRFVGIVTGHHEEKRVGDLVIFDPGVARNDADGAIQRIPGWGKRVQPALLDLPIGQTWPKFTHPYPIDDKTFLVACKTDPASGWRICLVDLFDNIVPLASEEHFALLEPIPIRPTPHPPTIPDRIQKGRADAEVFIADIYAGRGMTGVERGTVKSLRILSYQFAYQGMGAEPFSVGLDGPWDPKRILGTVPVNDDGSVTFTIPAMTPIAFQPLDAEGKAVQLMRSWITAEPGESVSCLGCHETQNETGAPVPRSTASLSRPLPIEPFYGPTRGFSFDAEIQPILDHYCLECHQPNSERTANILAKRGGTGDSDENVAPFVPDFRTGERKPLQNNNIAINTGALFSPSYYQLRRFVRTPTKESQMPTLRPFEFHADSTRLVQILQNGHYGVTLDAASWDRLVTWIDLNAPYHGNWGEIRGAEIPEKVHHQFHRRDALRELYATGSPKLDDDPTATEASHQATQKTIADIAQNRPDPLRNRRYIDIASSLCFGDKTAYPDAKRETILLDGEPAFDVVTIPGTDFAMGTTEVTNRLFTRYHAEHDTGIEYGDFINFSPGELGYALNRPDQPVARVTWFEAVDFCRWLTKKTGKTFVLPTAEQLEYAECCGGANLPPFENADGFPRDNLADQSYAAINRFGWPGRADILPAWRPADLTIDDRVRVSAPVASYSPNAWGLFDTLGNVAEWTATDATTPGGPIKKVVVGGSWATPRNRVTERRRFDPQMNVYDVGFRVIMKSL